jgi:ATP-dependent Clp protease ATP-binding subunit ClpB
MYIIPFTPGVPRTLLSSQIESLDKLIRAIAGHGKHILLIGRVGSGRRTVVSSITHHIRRLGLRNVFRVHGNALALSLYEPATSEEALAPALVFAKRHPNSLLLVEDIGTLADQLGPIELRRLLRFWELLNEHGIRVILLGTEESSLQLLSASRLMRDYFTSVNTVQLTEQEVRNVLNTHKAPPQLIPDLIALSARFFPEQALPGSALQLLRAATSIAAQRNVHAEPTIDDLHQHIAELKGIPLQAMSTTNGEKLIALEEHLQQAILGQPHAVRTVSSTLQRSLGGFRNYEKPIASFLFLGPSGVGKTELAKTLSRYLYHTPRAFTRIDMSEFSEAHTVQRLIGAPPGYVGYEEGGQLTNPVDREPYSLILLDEIEKAHPKVFDIFLQLLDDGRLTDGRGKTVDFRHTIVVATSNIGLHEIVRAAERDELRDSSQFLRREMLPLLVEYFRPELLNRFDALIVFQPLKEKHLIEIGRRVIAGARDTLGSAADELSVSEEELAALARAAYQPTFGARPMKRLIEERILAPLARRRLLKQKQSQTH